MNMNEHACNRKACQQRGARWWNRHMRAYYCTECAGLIARAQDPFAYGWFTLDGPDGESMDDVRKNTDRMWAIEDVEGWPGRTLSTHPRDTRITR